MKILSGKKILSVKDVTDQYHRWAIENDKFIYYREILSIEFYLEALSMVCQPHFILHRVSVADEPEGCIKKIVWKRKCYNKEDPFLYNKLGELADDNRDEMEDLYEQFINKSQEKRKMKLERRGDHYFTVTKVHGDLCHCGKEVVIKNKKGAWHWHCGEKMLDSEHDALEAAYKELVRTQCLPPKTLEERRTRIAAYEKLEKTSNQTRGKNIMRKKELHEHFRDNSREDWRNILRREDYEGGEYCELRLKAYRFLGDFWRSALNDPHWSVRMEAYQTLNDLHFWELALTDKHEYISHFAEKILTKRTLEERVTKLEERINK